MLDTKYVMIPVHSDGGHSNVNGIAVYDAYRRLCASRTLRKALEDATLVLELPTLVNNAAYLTVELHCAHPPPVATLTQCFLRIWRQLSLL